MFLRYFLSLLLALMANGPLFSMHNDNQNNEQDNKNKPFWANKWSSKFQKTKENEQQEKTNDESKKRKLDDLEDHEVISEGKELKRIELPVDYSNFDCKEHEEYHREALKIEFTFLNDEQAELVKCPWCFLKNAQNQIEKETQNVQTNAASKALLMILCSIICHRVQDTMKLLETIKEVYGNKGDSNGVNTLIGHKKGILIQTASGFGNVHIVKTLLRLGAHLDFLMW